MSIQDKQSIRLNRWYDAVVFVGKAVDMASSLPLDVQMLIGEHLSDRIDQYLSQQRNSTDLRSIGASKIMGLYNASYRQRWYDPNPVLRRAFTMMAALPEAELTDYAARMIHAATICQKEMNLTVLDRPRPTIIKDVEQILRDPETPILVQNAGDIRLAKLSDSKQRPGTVSQVTSEKPPTTSASEEEKKSLTERIQSNSFDGTKINRRFQFPP